jgi:hypothetical protein
MKVSPPDAGSAAPASSSSDGASAPAPKKRLTLVEAPKALSYKEFKASIMEEAKSQVKDVPSSKRLGALNKLISQRWKGVSG